MKLFWLKKCTALVRRWFFYPVGFKKIYQFPPISVRSLHLKRTQQPQKNLLSLNLDCFHNKGNNLHTISLWKTVHQHWCLNINTLEDWKIVRWLIHHKYTQLGFHQAPHQLRRQCEHSRKGQRIRMSTERVYSWFSSCSKLFSFTLLTGKDGRMAAQGAGKKWLVPICSLLFFTKYMHCCHATAWLHSLIYPMHTNTLFRRFYSWARSLPIKNSCSSEKNVATNTREVLVVFL